MAKLSVKLSGAWTDNIFVNNYWVETEKSKTKHSIKGVYDILERASSSERADISNKAAIDLEIYSRYHQKIVGIWTGEKTKDLSRAAKNALVMKIKKSFQQEL